MKSKSLFLSTLLCLCATVAVRGQFVTLNPSPARVLGQTALLTTGLSASSPNLVVGRELNSPQGIAVDTSTSPPILYVSDTGNNRVLAWRNAAQGSNGTPADLVIGQPDMVTTISQGPNNRVSTMAGGLSSPTGLAVDSNGNLYVVDAGNSRILRYPAPFNQTGIPAPDMVIGQPTLNTFGANLGGLSASSIATIATPAFHQGLAFDASGNLYFSDAGNHRVLRYRATDLASGVNGPSADMVLGQTDFVSQVRLGPASSNVNNKTNLDYPAGLAFDTANNRLYVADTDPGAYSGSAVFSRVVVFDPGCVQYSGFTAGAGMPACRIMGNTSGQAQPGAVGMTYPQQVFLVSGQPAVVDALDSRILVFPGYNTWPVDPNPPIATVVIGQADMQITSTKPNRGSAEPSATSLALPFAATVANGTLYVADSGNNRALVMPSSPVGLFSPANRVLGQDAFFAAAPNLVEGKEFYFYNNGHEDAGVVIDTTSSTPHLYVADTYNNRVLGFNDIRTVKPGAMADIVIGQPDFSHTDCNYNSSDPASGSLSKPNANGLCAPVGVAVDAAGNLWVADNANARVLRFANPFANKTALPAANLVIGQATFTSTNLSTDDRTMRSPYGVAFSSSGALLVSDSAVPSPLRNIGDNRVLYFPNTADGTYNRGVATKFIGQSQITGNGAGTDAAHLFGPHHIATDSAGRLYIADTYNSRVQIFDNPDSPNVPPTGAQALLSLPGVSRPQGVMVNQQTGEIWVADTVSQRLLRFPNFDQLSPINPAPLVADKNGISDPAPSAVAQDQWGTVYAADGFNRVVSFYPAAYAVNGANFSIARGLTPGAIASLCPGGLPSQQPQVCNPANLPAANVFGSQTVAAASVPLATDMGDVQVMVNDTLAPLYYVSPTQINFVVPWGAPTSGSANVTVLQKSTGHIYATGQIGMYITSPGIFIRPGNQAAVINQDGSINGPTSPATRGSTISIYGTGFGPLPNAPPDGQAPGGIVNSDVTPDVFIGAGYVPGGSVSFSGLSPQYPGLWQVNVTIPNSVAPGKQVPIFIRYKGFVSSDQSANATFITVQ